MQPSWLNLSKLLGQEMKKIYQKFLSVRVLTVPCWGHVGNFDENVEKKCQRYDFLKFKIPGCTDKNWAEEYRNDQSEGPLC